MTLPSNLAVPNANAVGATKISGNAVGSLANDKDFVPGTSGDNKFFAFRFTDADLLSKGVSGGWQLQSIHAVPGPGAQPPHNARMEDALMTGVAALLHWLAIPEVGLGAVFMIAFVSATLLPMGSEPAVFGLVKLQPELFWPAILVATVGNTLGGALTWWMGAAAHRAAQRVLHHGDAAPELQPGHDKAADHRALRWLQRYGAPACLLAWLPVVGDPLCAVAGWLRLPFWPCVLYMAIGKLARYVTMTALLVHLI